MAFYASVVRLDLTSSCAASAVSHADGRPRREERVPVAPRLPRQRLHRPRQAFLQKDPAGNGKAARGVFFNQRTARHTCHPLIFFFSLSSSLCRRSKAKTRWMQGQASGRRRRPTLEVWCWILKSVSACSGSTVMFRVL